MTLFHLKVVYTKQNVLFIVLFYVTLIILKEYKVLILVLEQTKHGVYCNIQSQVHSLR